MGNLIQTIPVYNPQPQNKPVVRQSPSVNNPVVKKPVLDIKNPFPQTEVYTYIPAKPLSPAPTVPQGVKPQPSTARLVHENFFQSVGSTIKSYGDYAKYFYKAAFKGEGDDYSVGKINDLAIRTGSLGIAAVLASSKVFPFAKGMEFVGLATWFASMAVWPQLLGAPIKAKTGVDINQEYIDTYGRRKYVYEDNGYRPMDIFRHVDLNGKPLTEEEYNKKYDKDYVYLDKVGDKLGIPRDIKNRHEAIMNKMGQVSVQGKTLWMLTAGIMTPVISSIVADAAQKPLKDYLEKTRYNNASKELSVLESQVNDMINLERKELSKVMDGLNIKIDPKVQSTFESLLTDHEALSPKEFEKLQKFLDKTFFGTGFHDSMREAMLKGVDMTEPKLAVNAEFKSSITKLTADAFKEIIEKLPSESRAKLPAQILNYKGMSEEQIQKMLTNIWSEGKSQIGFDATEALRHNVGMKALEPFIDADANNKQFIRSFNNAVRDLINKKTNAYIESQRHFVIPKDKMKEIFKFAYINNQLQSRLKKFEAASIKNISESMTAINWDRVPKKYLKAMGFTKGELAIIASQDTTTASKVLSQKFTEIAQDPDKFSKLVKEMAKYAKTAISKEEKAVIQLIGEADKRGTLTKVKDLMEGVAYQNFGEDVKNVLTRHYDSRIKEVQRKYRNTVDSYVRPIKTLDLFKDIKVVVKKILGNNAQDYINKINYDKSQEAMYRGISNRYYPFHNMSYEQAVKSLETYLKDAILQKNDINNWTTKFETELPDARRGMKYSLKLVQEMADAMFGELGGDTVNAVKEELPISNKDWKYYLNLVQQKADKVYQKLIGNSGVSMNDTEFIEKCNLNNSVMRARFLRIENELTKEYPSQNNFMTIRNYFTGLIERFVSGDRGVYKQLVSLLEDRRSNISSKDYTDCMNILKNHSRDDAAKNFLLNKLDFWSSNRAISQMTGKNVTDFFVNAAQESRSRNKWTKLVYGLLGGTLALSGVTIALMGKKNHFNKDKYEKINEAPQGAGK